MEEFTQDASLAVGEKIKRLREGANLTQQQLAERIGIDEGELKRIEDDLISPTLGVLVKVCDGLGVRMGHFFNEGPRKFYCLFRADENKATTRFASKSGADFGYIYHSLGSEKRNRSMEPFLITIKPPSDPDAMPTELEELATHSGEEFMFVLHGQIEVSLGEEQFLLQPGDSIYYDATVPHRVVHRGEKEARVLAVICLSHKS